MTDEFLHYAGRWIAVIDGKVVGQGGTPDQALESASIMRFKEVPRIIYVPLKDKLTFSPLLNKVNEVLHGEDIKFLVGGAIRDSLLKKKVHDYDIILSGDSLKQARKVADRLGGSYFPLDKDRGIARVILFGNGNTQIFFDFTTIQGDCLESDLRERDFTINSIASHLSKPNELLDPLGGLSDIKNEIIRISSMESFENDPVRILRAIRLAAGLEFKIDPDSRELMNQAAHQLVDVSQERVRDELFRIFDGPEPAKAIFALDIINATPCILPELKFYKNVTLPPPHTKDLWLHTLDTLKCLELMFIYFNQSPVIIDPKKFDDPVFNGFSDQFASIGRMLNHFWGKISDYLMRSLVSPRSIRSLLFFSAMYHDVAKADPQGFDGQEGYSSSDHGVIGSYLAAKRASALKLSNAEIDRIKKSVRMHMEPTYMARLDRKLTSLEIYRYFREVGEVGIDICLLSLADLLSTYGSSIPDERLERQLLVVHQLFDAWWNCPEKKIKPMSIVTGSDLISEFRLQPGPLVGLYLEKIREEQVQGTVKTREEALNFIKSIIDGSNHE